MSRFRITKARELWASRLDAVQEGLAVAIEAAGYPAQIGIRAVEVAFHSGVSIAAVRRVGRYMAPFSVLGGGAPWTVTYHRGFFVCRNERVLTHSRTVGG